MFNLHFTQLPRMFTLTAFLFIFFLCEKDSYKPKPRGHAGKEVKKKAGATERGSPVSQRKEGDSPWPRLAKASARKFASRNA